MDFLVTLEDERERLDKYLVKQLKDVPRNQVKRLIIQEKILVNKKKTSPSYNLRQGDAITIKTLKASSALTDNNFHADDLEIIEDGKGYLVVNKPSGLVVHKTKYIEEGTLVSLLLERYPDLERVGEYKDRPGIVHRLDKEVSGLMVVAKDQNYFYHLKNQFQKRRVVKKYQCLVFGCPPYLSEIIDFPLKRSPKTGKMITLPKIAATGQSKGKEAKTKYKVLTYYNNYTLLDLDLYTGKTHQIRVHLKSKGIPIVGDNIYTIKKGKRLNEKVSLGRIFLVAYKLGFYDIEGEYKEFTIGLAKELEDFLSKLK